MDMFVFGLLCLLHLGMTTRAEYCPAYYDYAHTLQPGFHCPSGVRLVGISDYYCCQNIRISNNIYCCNDRTRSVNFSHWSYGHEWIILNWPILLLLSTVVGFIVIFSYTGPRAAEMKENQIEDI